MDVNLAPGQGRTFPQLKRFTVVVLNLEGGFSDP